MRTRAEGEKTYRHDHGCRPTCVPPDQSAFHVRGTAHTPPLPRPSNVVTVTAIVDHPQVHHSVDERSRACTGVPAHGRRCSVMVRSSPCASADRRASAPSRARTGSAAIASSAPTTNRARRGGSRAAPSGATPTATAIPRIPSRSVSPRPGPGKKPWSRVSATGSAGKPCSSSNGAETSPAPRRRRLQRRNAIVLDGRLGHDVPTVVVLAADMVRWGAAATWDGAMRRAMYGDDGNPDARRELAELCELLGGRPRRRRCRPRHAGCSRAGIARCSVQIVDGRRLGTVVGRWSSELTTWRRRLMVCRPLHGEVSAALHSGLRSAPRTSAATRLSPRVALWAAATMPRLARSRRPRCGDFRLCASSEDHRQLASGDRLIPERFTRCSPS